MRMRYRRPVAVGVATLLASVAAVAVASPAMALDLCYNHFATIPIITSAGSYNGTSGNDVVIIKHSSGMVYFNPVGGSDEICRLDTSGTFTVWAAGNGHMISAAGPTGVTIYGSNGPDHIGGSSGNDLIKGNGGNDRITGYGGDDYIRGNDGDDYLDGHTGNDCIVGGRGYDEIYMGLGNDTVLTGHENRYSATQCAPQDWDTSQAATNFMNSLYGSGHGGYVHDCGFGACGGNDRVWGSNGVDYIDAGSGNDAVRGFGGNDTIYGGSGSDNLNGGYGNDTLSDYGDSVVDFLYGGPGTDKFYGKSNDFCYAGWDPPSMSCTPSPVYG